MKKFLFTLLLFIPVISYGQFFKGEKFIGGNLIFSTQTSNNLGNTIESKVNNFAINPSISFLLSDNFALGGQVGYSSFSQKNNSVGGNFNEYQSNGFSIGMNARRFFSISEKFMFSLNGLIDFNRGTATNSNNSVDSKTQTYQLSTIIRPNFLFFPSSKWGFEAGLGSLHYSYSRSLSTDVSRNYFHLDYGFFSLGLFYFFRKTN